MPVRSPLLPKTPCALASSCAALSLTSFSTATICERWLNGVLLPQMTINGVQYTRVVNFYDPPGTPSHMIEAQVSRSHRAVVARIVAPTRKPPCLLLSPQRRRVLLPVRSHCARVSLSDVDMMISQL